MKENFEVVFENVSTQQLPASLGCMQYSTFLPRIWKKNQMW